MSRRQFQLTYLLPIFATFGRTIGIRQTERMRLGRSEGSKLAMRTLGTLAMGMTRFQSAQGIAYQHGTPTLASRLHSQVTGEGAMGRDGKVALSGSKLAQLPMQTLPMSKAPSWSIPRTT